MVGISEADFRISRAPVHHVCFCLFSFFSLVEASAMSTRVHSTHCELGRLRDFSPQQRLNAAMSQIKRQNGRGCNHRPENARPSDGCSFDSRHARRSMCSWPPEGLHTNVCAYSCTKYMHSLITQTAGVQVHIHTHLHTRTHLSLHTSCVRALFGRHPSDIICMYSVPQHYCQYKLRAGDSGRKCSRTLYAVV